MTASLAFRKHETDIVAGNPPPKYLRLLPHIPGPRIIELGSAEGVLSLLLAQRGNQVTALEKNPDRHERALMLRDTWGVGGVRFVNGGIADHLDLLSGHDTLVAVRMIYYLGDDLNTIFAEVARKVPNVVLCGNKNRAARYHAGMPDEPLGLMNFYASAQGMTALLERHGYEITQTVLEGDPIVVGRSRQHPLQNLAA